MLPTPPARRARSCSRPAATARRAASAWSSSTTNGGGNAARGAAVRWPRGARRLRARAAAVASARHRPALPHAAAARAAGARSRDVRSVRCGGLPFPSAADPARSTKYSNSCSRRLIGLGREEALDTALGQIERQFGKGAVMRMNDHAHVAIGSCLHRLARARPRARDRRASARADRRDLRPGVLGQDDARLPRDRRGAAPRRHLRLHRRRARDGPAVRAPDRRQHRRPPRLAARQRRAGARDRRAARSAAARSTSSPSTRSPR